MKAMSAWGWCLVVLNFSPNLRLAVLIKQKTDGKW